MKIKIEKSELTNLTLMHLEAWILAIQEHLSNDHVFDSLDQLAVCLEEWKSEFCNAKKPIEEHQGDKVLIILYGNDLILICDHESGEYIKVKEEFKPKESKKTVIIGGKSALFNITGMLKKALLVCLTFTLAMPAYSDGIFKPRNGKAVVKKTNKTYGFKGFKIKYAKKQGINTGKSKKK